MASNLTPHERAIVLSHRTPRQVQRFLDGMPYNFEADGETLRSFRGTVRRGEAHCLEAALTAAAILECHGYPPLLLDLESVDNLDHVMFLFREERRWGSVARSRDPGLHGRKPVFPTVRALVRSYVLPFIDYTGRIEGYGILDLRDLRRVDWRFSGRNVWTVERGLIDNGHTGIRTSDREYGRWHRRYLAYKRRFPDRRPVYYPNRGMWLSSGPRARP